MGLEYAATSTCRIARLPDTVINQIAAGEVVERPSSVVKELLENSLDAGATRVDVLLTQGGTAEIAILDNGSGMTEEELLLAVERHTTSKLKAVSDLDSIHTFGFRGEALSSIASVAEVEIRSRTASEESGRQLVLRYGERIGELRPVAMPVGTAIHVRALFDRLPARQKFLRSPATEFSHAARVTREIALGNPQASFQLHHQGRRVASFAAQTRAGRFLECGKPDWQPIALEEETDGIVLEAYLSPPSHLQDRGELSLFVNGRGVKNRGLIAAVRNAYLGALGPHHEPSGVVYLDLRPDWVDVNVHPQKTEVRVLRQESLYQWLQASVRKALAQALPPRAAAAHPADETGHSEPVAPLETRWTPREAPGAPWRPLATRLAWNGGETGTSDSPSLEAERAATESNPPLSATVFEAPWPEPAAPKFRFLGQLRSALLVCEDSQGLVLVEPHALHETVAMAELEKRASASPLPSQPLLVPKILRLSGDLASLIEEHQTALSALGFEVEAFGDGDLALRARPECLSEPEAERTVSELVRALAEADTAPGESVARPLAAGLRTLACHMASPRGESMSVHLAERLLNALPPDWEGIKGPHGTPLGFRVEAALLRRHFQS